MGEKVSFGNIEKIECCPYCGAKQYYTQIKIRGHLQTVFDLPTKKEVENIEKIYPMKPAKYAYCVQCNACIGKIKHNNDT